MKDELAEVIKEAAEFQSQLKKAQAELNRQRVTGVSGAGQVKIEMTGRFDATKVEIDPELMRGDREFLEDLIAGAINDAVRRVEQLSQERLVFPLPTSPVNPRS